MAVGQTESFREVSRGVAAPHLKARKATNFSMFPIIMVQVELACKTKTGQCKIFAFGSLD